MSEKFEVLNDREHTLLKAHIMLGSLVEEDYQMYVGSELTTLRVVPAVIKMVAELLDNCIDEYIRSEYKHSNKINITINPMSVIVEDNGRGIPVETYTNSDGVSELRPVLCWTRLRAGTSFHEHEIGPSSNGVGSSVVNILSNFFSGETCDGKKFCKVTCRNNMEEIDSFVESANGRKRGTKVIAEPDFTRFGISCFSEDHIIAIKERVLALSAVYPDITFTFNGEKIKTKKPKEYLEKYKKSFVGYYSEKYFFGVMPTETDEYYQNMFLEGLHVKNGGTLESYIARELANSLKTVIQKKHKLELSVGEIKRGLMLVVDGKMFPNMKYDSQTKERLVNSESEVKSYLGEIPYEKLAKEILENQEIISPIISLKLAKLEAAEKRAVTIAQKKMSKKYVENHIPAKGKNISETICLFTEGLSALGGIEKVRDVNKHGGFPLRGKPKQVYDSKEKEILDNKELSNIMTVLGLRFDMTDYEIDTCLNYGRIGVFADGDLDGAHILSLLILFFSRWKRLFETKRVVLVQPPMYIFTKNKGKKNEDIKFFYSKDEYNQALKNYSGYEVRYIKGNGSLTDKELKKVLTEEEKWKIIELDDIKCLDIMFGNDVQKRRAIMEI